ncbi:Post-segregation antitoxin CcdA [Desulfonatronospira thiodismutans ASO3-1]|uniref:Post-segregation antitoxin CcdA n=1 Tax=Desulfonatronospira thiodismutans ASO3-1 TaxID=555779 RepID=D6SRW4_9BACT|nr:MULTISPECIES: type II toxin-antitoxin system CcdA family antitoxin [Desulfonatronospira]EFI33430.1 Post-segregation antitoxin CcdA [Desulfonatronospira thiodismutans ASO3-1]
MENTTRKQPVNLRLRGDLLHKARSSNINLSQTLEQSLQKILKEQDRLTWMKENREAMEAANRYVDEHGLWSDGSRMF